MSVVNAAGTTQGTATLLTGDVWYRVESSDASNRGVRLPPAASVGLGERREVWNWAAGTATIDVYPATGEAIDGLSANAAVTLRYNFFMVFISTATGWVTQGGIDAGGGGTGVSLRAFQSLEAPIISLSVWLDAGSNPVHNELVVNGVAEQNYPDDGNAMNFNWVSQTTNKVFAAPNGSTGAPTFRALVAADIPSLAASKITSGTLAIAQGGTNAATANANVVFAGPASGSAAAPSFRALVAADIPAATQELAVAAAGTVQGNATALTNTATNMIHEITSGGAGTGVIFPSGIVAGSVHWIRNKKGSALNVYPASGGAIDALAANAAISVPNNQMYPFVFASTTQIYTTK